MNDNDNVFYSDDRVSNAELVNNDSFLRLKAKNKHKEIRRKIFYFLIGALLIFLISVVCIIVFFGLKKVEINGNSRYTKEEILSAAGFSSTDNLFGLDLEKAKESIMQKCPYISKVSFKRVLPSTLIISVTEEAPGFCTEIYGDYFLLSDDLRVISKHDMYEDIEILSLPIVYIKLPTVERAVAGEKIVFDKISSYDHLISFLTELRKHDIFSRTDCIDAQDRYHLSLYSDECRYKIDLGIAESIDTKLKFVDRVISEAYNEYSIVSINVEKVNQIVVREYDNPFQFR